MFFICILLRYAYLSESKYILLFLNLQYCPVESVGVWNATYWPP